MTINQIEPFREPVAWQKLGLYDYPKIIKKPMDLGTIKKRITDRKHYKSFKEIDEDVRLVWTNCMTYNADGSDFFILAQNLNKKWTDKFTKFCSDNNLNSDGSSVSKSKNKDGAGSSSTTNNDSSLPASNSNASAAATPNAATSSSNINSKTTLDEKRAFARSLYKISREDLGRVLVEVEMKCPAALSKNSAEDEVEFNVDKLTPNVFQDLVNFVKNCPNGGSSSGNANTNSSSAGAGDAASTSDSKSSKKKSSSTSGSVTKRQKTS